MIFVARYKDGSCGIADAPNEEKARELLESEDASFDIDDDEIVSLRRLDSPFVSRWYFEDVSGSQASRFAGALSHEVAHELFQHEYPAIYATYTASEHKGWTFDPNEDELPIICNAAQMKRMHELPDNLVREVRQAIQYELKRCRE